MARPLARPDLGAIALPQIRVEQVELLGTDNFDAGWVADLSARRIPENALADIQNFIYVRGRLIGQNNSAIYSIPQPNNNKVMAITSFFNLTTGLNLMRFDRQKIYKANSLGWVEFVPNPGGIAMTGTDEDYFSFAQGDNRFFFSNWGVDPIREIDTVALQYIAVGNAPRYKYITTGFNRLIGANSITASDPVLVGWSGDLNYTEWDPLVDISAGSTPLVSSPSDTSDVITGIYNISTFLVITRERSIFIGQNQPSATQPFFFYAALPRLGADLPRCIALTEDGLVWFNYQTAGVYKWNPPDGQPEEISLPIRKTLKTLVEFLQSIPTDLFASYNFDKRVFSLFIRAPSSTDTVEISYSFVNKTWYKSLWMNLSTAFDSDVSASTITIDELLGNIDNLIGTIDQLGGLLQFSTRFMGWNTGAIYTLVDFSGIYSQESGSLITPAVSGFVIFKTLEIPIEDTIFNYARFEFTPYQTGTVTLQGYVDDNLTDLRVAKTMTITSAMINKPQLVYVKKAVHTRQIIFKLIATGCVIELTGFYARGQKSGVSVK